MTAHVAHYRVYFFGFFRQKNFFILTHFYRDLVQWFWSARVDHNTVTSAIARLGHFTPPARVDFATEAKAERRCQARSGELPTILRTEAAHCGRKRAATLLAPEPETLEQPLPPIALYVSIYVFLCKRGIARTTRESSYNLLRVSTSLFFSYIDNSTCIIF